MSYTAFTQMREMNKRAYGIPYPAAPKNPASRRGTSALAVGALNFIHNRCEGLRFDPARSDLTDRDGQSLKKNQIPFNMQMDIDRLCFENAIDRFLRSGAGEDAFDVYFCYLEMFIGCYGKTKKMIELLSEFESSAASLLLKHRDHYSHSVYVFCLGLAIYDSSEVFRRKYAEFYGISEEPDSNGVSSAHHFLKNWGLTALFHDIGYPFELPFEQVKAYFGGSIDKVPMVSYRFVEAFSYTDDNGKEKNSYRDSEAFAGDFNALIAEHLCSRLSGDYGVSAAGLAALLEKKPSSPDAFGGYMDHAWFSAILLTRKLKELEMDFDFPVKDAIGAIILHNSLFKHAINKKVKKPLKIETYPLAYMLMLCDELQAWDRRSYGQNSRAELHAMDCEFVFDGESISADYLFDSRYEPHKNRLKGTYKKLAGENPKFLADIEEITDVNAGNGLKLKVSHSFGKSKKQKNIFLSDSNYMHMYNFASAIHARHLSPEDEAYLENIGTDRIEAYFDEMALEYKLSCIIRTKAFAGYLDRIGCFYTDKAVAYEPLEAFTPKHMDIIGPMEHHRWIVEKKSMGWTGDDAYTECENSKEVRELTRTHSLINEEYEDLSPEMQNKDTEPMNLLLKLLDQYDGLRIYKIP